MLWWDDHILPFIERRRRKSKEKNTQSKGGISVEIETFIYIDDLESDNGEGLCIFQSSSDVLDEDSVEDSESSWFDDSSDSFEFVDSFVDGDCFDSLTDIAPCDFGTASDLEYDALLIESGVPIHEDDENVSCPSSVSGEGM